jgi:hypothetical protein
MGQPLGMAPPGPFSGYPMAAMAPPSAFQMASPQQRDAMQVAASPRLRALFGYGG